MYDGRGHECKRVANCCPHRVLRGILRHGHRSFATIFLRVLYLGEIFATPRFFLGIKFKRRLLQLARISLWWGNVCGGRLGGHPVRAFIPFESGWTRWSAYCSQHGSGVSWCEFWTENVSGESRPSLPGPGLRRFISFAQARRARSHNLDFSHHE